MSEDLQASYLLGLPDLRAHAPEILTAFAAYPGNAAAYVRKEALNLEVFVAALLATLPPARPLRVGVAGISPVTEPLCAALNHLEGVTACVIDAAHQTYHATIHPWNFFSSLAAAENSAAEAGIRGPAIDVWVDPKVDLKANLSVAFAINPDLPSPVPPGTLGAYVPAVAAAYLHLLRQRRTDFARTMASHIENAETPLVIFVAHKVQYNQLRFSRALRRAGHRTVSVLFDPNRQEQQRDSFDDVVVIDLLSFLSWVNQAPPVLLHTQGWLFGYHVQALIEAYKAPGVAQICETMDLNSFLFPPEGIEPQLPFMKQVWGADCRENHLTQCACEKAIFARADGVVFEGDEGHQRALGLRDEPRFLNFPTYPLHDFFAQAPRRAIEGLTLVFAAGVVASGGRHVPEIFSDAQWHRTAQHLLSRGCTVHVYNNPGHGLPATYAQKYPEHLALVAAYPDRYRFEVGAGPAVVAERICGYDYGLMIYDFDDVIIGEEHFANIIPSKFFMYLEAGLPVLVSDRFRATCELVRAFDIGRAVSAEEYRSLPDLLATLDPEAHRKNVLRAREALAVDAQLGRLLALYDRARAARGRWAASDARNGGLPA